MSLKGYAVLAAIGFHNHRSHNENSNSSNTIAQTTLLAPTSMTPATATPTPTSTTSLSSMSPPLPSTQLINSNKSTLIQLKQQQSDIVLTTTTAPQTPPLSSATQNTKPVLLATATVIDPAPQRPLNPYISDSSDRFETYATDDHHLRHQHSGSSSGRNIYTDSDDEEATTVDGDGGNELAGRQRPVNTFYGSGFGIFHQQRSNMGGAGGGGGIALITSNSGSGLGGSSYSNGINNNVNLLLGGAMLTLITTILCVVCYCCHRNIKKRTEAAYRQQRQWLENDPNMEIYSVEQCYETSGLFVGDSMDGLATIPALHHEPPPSYDAVVAMQEQQQLLMQQQQQQLLLQQLQNNSPPPGYRSSLDVSCILTARTATLAPAVLGMGSTDTNSLAASATNIRASISRTPPDGHDFNGNRDMVPATATTSASIHSQQPQQQQLPQPNFLRVAKQRQRNLPAANLTNFNMKKVLQAQSCCSLQRAEVENMWNAAAAALAARSNHVTTDARGTASTSSPTLVMNNRKLSNAHTSKATTPETFGSRYLKQQNYYRRGCPLCGKFRYDNESTLSISIESDLDNMTTVCDSRTGDGEGEGERGRRPDDTRRGHDEYVNCYMETGGDGGVEDDEEGEGEDDECSCLNSHHRQVKPQALRKSEASPASSVNRYDNNAHDSNAIGEDIELTSTTDLNANRTVPEEAPIEPSTTSSLTNNNNEEASCMPTTSVAAVSPSTSSASALTPSTNSVTIDLDCINENGIISLDMSKIIDKTGLPTYDAALKLESSGYV